MYILAVPSHLTISDEIEQLSPFWVLSERDLFKLRPVFSKQFFGFLTVRTAVQ